MGLRSFLGAGEGGEFDSYDGFTPDHLPAPGPFLEEPAVAVLTGREHAAVHRLARALFERRGVYDITFGYNLARLNLDRRHPTAGFRYGEQRTGERVLRAEFTPTTEFCPQSDTLTVGAFRAFNGESERHEYDLVRVRVDRSHHEATRINGTLRQLETAFEETGELIDVATDTDVPTERGYGPGEGGGDDADDGPATPF